MTLKTAGTVTKDDGYRKVYQVLKADPTDKDEDEDILPDISEGAEADRDCQPESGQDEAAGKI